jgi:uncharacterized protein YkwD
MKHPYNSILFFNVLIIFISNAFGQEDSCASLNNQIAILENKLKNEENDLNKHLLKSRIYEKTSLLNRKNCNDEFKLILGVTDLEDSFVDSLITRSNSNDLYSSYYSYLDAVASDDCCKSLKYWDYEYYKFPYEEFIKMKFLKKRLNFKKLNYPILRAAIIYKVNEYRREQNLPLLYFNRSLEVASIEHALDIARTGVSSHIGGFPGRETPLRRAISAGYTRSKVAENLSQDPAIEFEPEDKKVIYTPEVNGGYFSYKLNGRPIKPRTYLGMAERVVKSFINNAEKKKVVLSSEYLDIGVGIVHFKDNRYFGMDEFYVVQLLGGN